MSGIEGLRLAYEEFVKLPWDDSLAGPQRVWFAIYEPTQERRLRLRIDEFAAATRSAGHGWRHADLTSAFAEWMSANEYRDAYFEDPEAMAIALSKFKSFVVERVGSELMAEGIDRGTVVAVSGIGALFGLMRISELVGTVAPLVRGRLLIFFPGRRDGSSYRIFDARDGWDYLAIPIEAKGG